MPTTTAPDGTALAYQTAGRGPALLLLAGQSNNHRWWDATRPDFEDRFTTVTMDWRGTGDSGKPDEPYSTHGFAGDVVAVLDALGLERAHVYGTSMGGRVAQWLAADRPERVGALILGCTSPGGPNALERDTAVRKALVQPDRAAADRFLLELMYTPGWLETHQGPYFTVGDPDMPGQAVRRHLAASNGHDAWDALPAIKAPTLVLHGADDVFNPAANAPLIAERVPDAELRLIEGARHAYFEEFRAVASPVVLDFLARRG